MEKKKETACTTYKLRSWFGWTQADFADQFGIPLRTIQNWDSRRCMPSWVESMAWEIRESWNQISELDRKIRQIQGEV